MHLWLFIVALIWLVAASYFLHKEIRHDESMLIVMPYLIGPPLFVVVMGIFEYIRR